jgi:antitoxin component YwqK of YwqJK toxin-antitoxin module
MKLKYIIAILIFLLPASLICQTTTGLNKSDATGKKQGYWVKKYPDGAVMYEGLFIDNYPEGVLKRYNQDGTIRSVLNYSNKGLEADAEIYHPNGFLSARGKYIKQKKEGLWQFYSEFVNGYLVGEEYYSENLKNGKSTKLYPDGTVAEVKNFVNDTAQGEWIKYYSNGVISLKSTIQDGKINGKFEAWFENDTLQFSGEYRNDKREGTWLIYEKDGKLRYRLEYVNGITNDRKMDIDISDYLDSLEINKGKIPDPEKTGNIW